MILEVRLFARARELAGTDVVSVETPEPATVADVKQALMRACPALVGLMPACALAIEQDFARESDVVPRGAEVVLLPPVSGGAEK